MEEVYDYIVVGSGFGGSVASLRLSEKGTRYDPDDLISLRNPLKFPKVIFDMKCSTNLVIFLVMQHIENSMRMIWRPGLLGGRICHE